MVKFLIIGSIIALVIFMIYLFIYCKITNARLKSYFKESSCIVYGAKGKGKDLIFQKIIYMKRKKPYYSNIYYGYKYYKEPIRNLSVYPNTFKKFINNNVSCIDKKEEYEGIDYYISDAGVFLPAQYNGELNKSYSSLPIYYALSRHLYKSNIHMNTQFLGRAWNMLREQADKFIKACGKIKIGNWIFVKVLFYDKYESAMSNILPMKRPPLFNKFYKAEYEQFNSTYGEIKKGIFLLKVKDIRYDTRVFHKIVFGRSYIDNKIINYISSLTKEEIKRRNKLIARRKVKQLLKLKYNRYLLLIKDKIVWAKKDPIKRKIKKESLKRIDQEKKNIKGIYKELKKNYTNITFDDLQKLEIDV